MKVLDIIRGITSIHSIKWIDLKYKDVSNGDPESDSATLLWCCSIIPVKFIFIFTTAFMWNIQISMSQAQVPKRGSYICPISVFLSVSHPFTESKWQRAEIRLHTPLEHYKKRVLFEKGNLRVVSLEGLQHHLDIRISPRSLWFFFFNLIFWRPLFF